MGAGPPDYCVHAHLVLSPPQTSLYIKHTGCTREMAGGCWGELGNCAGCHHRDGHLVLSGACMPRVPLLLVTAHGPGPPLVLHHFTIVECQPEVPNPWWCSFSDHREDAGPGLVHERAGGQGLGADRRNPHGTPRGRGAQRMRREWGVRASMSGAGSNDVGDRAQGKGQGRGV